MVVGGRERLEGGGPRQRVEVRRRRRWRRRARGRVRADDGRGQAAGGAALRLTRITNVKVRAFTAPGATLVLSAQVAAPGSDDLEPYMVKLTAQAEGKTIAGAKMYFVPAGETA